MPARKRRPSLSSLLVRLVAGGVLLAVVLSSAAVAALRWLDPPLTSVMLLEPGPFRDIHYAWLPRGRIAATAAKAVIAAEDQKFLDHNGFDLAEINKALQDFRAGDGLRGASTITQQVAKNLFLWQGRSFVRKGLEAYFALLLETFLPKERILEIYLNVAEFGPGVFGVGAAAQRLLGADAATLTASQAALLAAVLPSPKRLSAAQPSAYVRDRQAAILEQMRLLEGRGHYRGLVW
ncbi:MAG TPA: monofunctional biosynthetic peptidoglycan transglycosylase [Gammaproteobacteria bacterium]